MKEHFGDTSVGNLEGVSNMSNSPERRVPEDVRPSLEAFRDMEAVGPVSPRPPVEIKVPDERDRSPLEEGIP